MNSSFVRSVRRASPDRPGAGVPRQPVLDRGGFVSGEVIADQVHVQADGHGLVDPDWELLGLRGAVAPVQGGDHPAVGDVERGEQDGGLAADVRTELGTRARLVVEPWVLGS
jgi:hypothetical protein